MKRMERIRETVVSRIVSADDWWQSDEASPEEDGAMPMYGRMGRHLSHRVHGRRHKIIERVLDLASREFNH